MKNKTIAVTIGSVILGVGMTMGTVAFANHGHTGNNTATGMGMMGSAPQTIQQNQAGHMGAVKGGGHMGTPVTTATNQHDMQGAGKTGTFQNHMNGTAGGTANQHHGTTDHHNTNSGK